jgi:PilZ domain-containing protein
MTHPAPISSIQVRDRRVHASPGRTGGERRSRVRFPFELPVRYRTIGRGEPFTGVGWVVNMSSTGVLVAYQQQMRAGARVELNIEWPSLLDGQVPLRLVTMGKVIRCDAGTFAMALGGYQFRTTKRAVTLIDAARIPARAASA